MNRNRLSMTLAAALIGSVALVGCKKKEEPVVTTPPAAETTTPPPVEPAPVASTAVSSVDLGNAIGADNKIASPISSFGTKDKVYASVVTDGPNAAKLNAKWTFQDGQVVHTEDKDVPAGPQVTQFEVSKPDGWPAGKYTLEVSLDGAVVQTKQFDVK